MMKRPSQIRALIDQFAQFAGICRTCGASWTPSPEAFGPARWSLRREIALQVAGNSLVLLIDAKIHLSTRDVHMSAVAVEVATAAVISSRRATDDDRQCLTGRERIAQNRAHWLLR